MATWEQFRTSKSDREGIILEETRLNFSHSSFRTIPSFEIAEQLGQDIRSCFIQNAANLAIAESIVDQNDWGIKYRPFGIQTTARAFLISHAGEFTISINTEVDQPGTDIDDYYAALIGHEIGHTFFFAPGKRALKVSREPIERYVAMERWCDHFSLHLTGVELVNG